MSSPSAHHKPSIVLLSYLIFSYAPGVVTLYRFFIDKNLGLPVKVEESTPDGPLERTITFQNLRITKESIIEKTYSSGNLMQL